MACALVSLVSGIAVRHDVAMTGELTLRGKVLPIGGLKEKLLAAARAGIRTVIVPAANIAELSEIPEHVRSKVEVVPAKTMRDVLNVALVKPPRRATGATSRSRGPSARA
jgi:ATP-dependent Lon protease